MNLKIKRVKSNALLPKRASPGAAGMDLHACLQGNELSVAPMERVLVPTGIAIEIPKASYVALLFPRSGLSFKDGLTMVNGVGVIDSDYRGEISVPLINLSNTVVHITQGQRIAQLVTMPIEMPEIVEIAILSETERGAGGFGST